MNVVSYDVSRIFLLRGGRVLQDVYIVGMNRIPFGKYRGFYKDRSAVDLGVLALKGLLKKNIVPQAEIDNILVGKIGRASCRERVSA